MARMAPGKLPKFVLQWQTRKSQLEMALLELPWLRRLNAVTIRSDLGHVAVQNLLRAWQHEHVQPMDWVILQVLKHVLHPIGSLVEFSIQLSCGLLCGDIPGLRGRELQVFDPLTELVFVVEFEARLEVEMQNSAPTMLEPSLRS